MAIKQLLEIQDQERRQDSDLAQLTLRIETLERKQMMTKCVIMQLNERIDDLEINNTYLMGWRVMHDNDVARNRKSQLRGKTNREILKRKR